MGIGGGFLLVPMLIYLMRVPTATVIGTSMVLTFLTMVSATVLHAATNHLVDAVLALILMVGGVIGAQFGAHAGQRIRGEWLRLLLGLLVLAVGLRFAFELVLRPDDLYSIRLIGERTVSCALAAALGAGAFLAGAGPVGAAERLVASLTNHRVLITSNYTGVELVLFGSVERDAASPARERPIRYRRDRYRAAADVAHAAQTARARHLGEYRVTHVCRSALLPRRPGKPAARRHRQRRDPAAAQARDRRYAASRTDQQRHRRSRPTTRFAPRLVG